MAALFGMMLDNNPLSRPPELEAKISQLFFVLAVADRKATTHVFNAPLQLFKDQVGQHGQHGQNKN